MKSSFNFVIQLMFIEVDKQDSLLASKELRNQGVRELTLHLRASELLPELSFLCLLCPCLLYPVKSLHPHCPLPWEPTNCFTPFSAPHRPMSVPLSHLVAWYRPGIKSWSQMGLVSTPFCHSLTWHISVSSSEKWAQQHFPAQTILVRTERVYTCRVHRIEQCLAWRLRSSVSIRAVIIHRCPPGSEPGFSGQLSKELTMCIHFQKNRMKYDSTMVWNQRHLEDKIHSVTGCSGEKGSRGGRPKDKVQGGPCLMTQRGVLHWPQKRSRRRRGYGVPSPVLWDCVTLDKLLSGTFPK